MRILRICASLLVFCATVQLHPVFVRSQQASAPGPAEIEDAAADGIAPATAPMLLEDPVPEVSAEEMPANVSAVEQQDQPELGSALTLDTELSGIMQECAIFMGNQQPAESSTSKDEEEIEATRGGKCRKQRGRLPIEWEPAGRNLTGSKIVRDAECFEAAENMPMEDPVQSSLKGCIASCTVARQCNFITFMPTAGSDRGTCTSFHIDATCFNANGSPRCYDVTNTEDTIGFSLGDCPFAAEPSGDIIARSFGLFKAMQQDAANGLAIAASTITIILAVAGAPCSFLSKIFKL